MAIIKPTIYPTLVVGVGGMGTNTVRAVKRRFRNVWSGDKSAFSDENGESEQLPGMIQLMALDTEPLVNRLDQEPLFADEFAYMGKFDATRLIANLDQHPEIARWWNYPSIPLGYIHNGNNARIVGIFFLPDVIEEEISSDLQRRRIRANAYAAMKELNYFQETQKFKALYPSEQVELPDVPYAPFDFIFMVGRTNRDGRSLARKSDAEQMAAHLIQMTTISHLSSEILGLEVNVVRERMLDMDDVARDAAMDSAAAAIVAEPDPNEIDDKRRNFLMYSSFATSALVIPHESMLDFWQRAFVTDLIRRFASGPSMTDPREAMSPSDQQRVLNLWKALLSQLLARYAALDNDRLQHAQTEISEQRGIWEGFWEPVKQTMRQALLETGVRGALNLCDLIGPTSDAVAAIESLPRQRLFLVNGQSVSDEDRGRWRKLLAQEGGFGEQARQLGSSLGQVMLTALNPRQARERSQDSAGMRGRARLYQRRDAVERMLVEQLGKQTALLRETLRSQIDTSAVALARANQEATRLASRLQMRRC